MQVKVFESLDMASGLKMVKKELGPEALIISTKTVRNGKLGLLGKPTLEITAAIDSAIPLEQSFNSRVNDTFRLESGKNRTGFYSRVDQPIGHLLQHSSTDTVDVSGDFSLSHKTGRKSNNSFLAEEVNDLKNLVKNLSSEISRMHTNNDSFDSAPHTDKTDRNLSLSGQLEKINSRHEEVISMLRAKGVNSNTAHQVATFLREKVNEKESESLESQASVIIDAIQKFLHVAQPMFDSQKEQQRIAFVGPTGVGKTTTLAKIAASYLAGYSDSIALITIDTYRIAAVEQLKVYGEIMRLPVDVVITPEQLKLAIEKHHDKELILIDTAGRSPRDGLCIAELATFLSPELNIDKQLVLSATTREEELFNTIEQFSGLGITNNIFTKIDECSSLGVLLNIQIEDSNPLSYVTNGQRVPEDLVEVSQNRIAELIMSQNEGSLHD